MSDISLDDLRVGLSEFKTEKKVVARSPKEERIVAGFEEIQKFVDENGRLPEQSEGNDIFERLYAARLEALRRSKECVEVLAEIDFNGLLSIEESTAQSTDNISLDDLRAELHGVDGQDDITSLKHVKTRDEKRAAEEIANRQKCEDFEKFADLFKVASGEIESGLRKTIVVRKDAGFHKALIEEGKFFIQGGLLTYVASVGDETRAPNGDRDARLRLIFANGTESSMLLRSLQRRLYEDDSSRIVTELNDAGPLFGSEAESEDIETGTIYVLRSQSDHPLVAENRELVHKIGVTTNDVEKRIAGAHLQPTFLMAKVEIVATYNLFNISQTKFEKLLHKVISSARLDIEIPDRFGNPVRAQEWFLVPLFIIEEIVHKIIEGQIGGYMYDPQKVALIPRE